jgi:hypothetical protein
MASHADVDEAAIHELFTEHGDLGEYLLGFGEEVAVQARMLAPRDTGHLKDSIVTVLVTGASGNARVVVGAGAHAEVPFGKTWAAGYPYALALDSDQGYTWNRGSLKFRRTVRPLHRFLTRALELVAASRG